VVLTLDGDPVGSARHLPLEAIDDGLLDRDALDRRNAMATL
jgi:hypothetical protein